MLLFISGAEIVFVFFIVLLVFGADKIPSIARTLAKGMTQVRQATNDIKSEIQKSVDVENPTKSITSEFKKEVDEVKKDFTDLEGALKLLPSEIEYIHTMGFFGGRLDHQLVVIGNLFNQVNTYNCKVSLLDSRPMLIFPRGKNIISIKGSFSILSLFHTIISINGDCTYQVQNTELHPFSGHGLSNIGSGDVEIKSNQPIGIYLFSPEEGN